MFVSQTNKELVVPEKKKKLKMLSKKQKENRRFSTPKRAEIKKNSLFSLLLFSSSLLKLK